MEYIYLFFSSLISATLFPLGSEALFVYDLSIGLNLYLLLLSATLGNTIGAIVNYYFGLKGEEYLVEKNLLKQSSIDKYKNYFTKYGSFLLLLTPLPIIGDPITFIAGVFRFDIKKFIIIVAFAKFIRYYLLTFI